MSLVASSWAYFDLILVLGVIKLLQLAQNRDSWQMPFLPH